MALRFPSLSPLFFSFSPLQLLLLLLCSPFSLLSFPLLSLSLGLLPLLSSLSGFSSPSLRLLFLLSPSPVFIGKNRGGDVVGQPLLAAPPPSLNTWKVGQVGVPFRHHFEGRRRLIEGERGGEQKKKNNSSSPASLRVQGKKMMVSFKTAPFWVLSFFKKKKQCMKRRRFYQNASFHLNGFGAKTRQI